MQTADINKKLVDGYLELFRNLSQNNKLDLISGLSNSLKSDKKQKNKALKSIFGDFIPEKSAEIIIEDLKKARSFTRDTETF